MQRLRQPGVRLVEMAERGRFLSTWTAIPPIHDISTAETIVKYHGYLKRQHSDIERSRRDKRGLSLAASLMRESPGCRARCCSDSARSSRRPSARPVGFRV